MKQPLKIGFFLLKRRIADSDFTRVIYSHGLLFLSLCASAFSRNKAVQLAMASARAFNNSLAERLVINQARSGYFLERRKRAPVTNGEFGTRCFLLKEKVSSDEKGVVLLKFNSTIRDFPLFVDMEKFLSDYHLVLEPSWTGFVDEDILQYTAYREPIWVLSSYPCDYDFLVSLEMNLVPVRLGPCDWVDPSVSEPFIGRKKIYDIVFNSNWAPWKRHQVLFSHLAKLNKDLKVALIGVEWEGRCKQDIIELAKFYGVQESVELFERISFSEVQRITSESKLSILLSKKEGSNRAIAEAMMCDVPAIILEGHIGGIVKNIVPETGLAINQDQLSNEIRNIISGKYKFSPRAWALQNASCHSSTSILNKSIKNRCNLWTNDIYVRANSPEPTYVGKSPDKDISNFSMKDYFIN